MFSLIGTSLALGVGGLDPTPALILAAVLLAGGGKRSVTALALTVMLGAPLFGSVLALTVADELDDIDWWVIVPMGRVGAIVELIIGLALLVVAVVRIVRRDHPDKEHHHHDAGALAAMAAAGVYVGALVISPTFVAVTVLAGRAETTWVAVAMEVAWVLIAQIPLLALLIMIGRIGRQRAAEDFQRWWTKIKPVLTWVITGALVLAGAVLSVDALWWLTTGHFLLPDHHPTG